MALPQDILEAAGRVWEYHLGTKLTEASPQPKMVRPPTRVFDYLPKTPLSPKLLDLPTPTLTLLTKGVDVLPESMQSPPQDLRTLSTWLYMAAGQKPGPAELPRASEIYVAAFAIEGLTPGLYHFAPGEFALRQLRDGNETMALLRRGRPDLNFLTTVPGALLVSTVFSRANALYGKRGYRAAVVDAGQMVADCVAVATGLGIRTMTRLKMTESPMRELIGLPEDFDDASAESVQAMVVWADPSPTPMPVGPPVNGPLMTLPRPDSAHIPPQPAVLAVHRDVTMRGLPAREIRSPLTEFSPVGVNLNIEAMPMAKEPASKSLREVLTTLRPADGFHKKPIGRDAMCAISEAGFHTGTFFPLRPDGENAALVRPMWVTMDAVVHEPGLWYHDPMLNGWAFLENGDHRLTVGPMTRGREGLETAGAVCAIVANLRKLLLEAGPDVYRLALEEAGLAARRMHLAAVSLGYVGRVFTDFYDEPWRQFLRLNTTGWEVLAIFAMGGPVQAKAPEPVKAAPVVKERAAGIIGFRD